MNKLNLILIILLVVASGCDNTELSPNNEKIIFREDISKENEANTVEMIGENQTNLELVVETDVIMNSYNSNEYFYSNQDETLFDGYFEFIDVFNQDVFVTYKLVAEEELFEVYEVVIEGVENVPQDRLFLGFFCVYNELIYRFDTIEDVNTYIDSGNLPENISIIFSTTSVEDNLEKEEKGLHQYIEVKDDEVEYHAYNNLIETGYYETYIWKQGVGLTFYQSGFGAGRQSIVIKLITE